MGFLSQITGENLTPRGLPFCKSFSSVRLSLRDVRSSGSQDSVGGMDPILTHTWWKKSTPKSGRDNSVVSTRDVTLTAEEKGQPRCKFCLTTTYIRD